MSAGRGSSTALSPDDVRLLDGFAALRPAVQRGDRREALQQLATLRQLTATRLYELLEQANAVAEANARSIEIMERLEELSGALEKQNAALLRQNSEIDAARREVEEQARAAAEANVDAVLELERSEAHVQEVARRQAVLADRAAVLAAEVAALAEANVNAVEVLGEKEDTILRLETRMQLLEKSRLELEEKAFVDPVTGLFNYRYFRETMQMEVARARRYARALSLVFLDLDHFKTINDRFGHPAGDRVLCDVAATLAKAIRAADVPVRMDGNAFAARYGGEEFVVILPETGGRGGLVVAERLRSLVADRSFVDTAGVSIGQVTLSGGVAELRPDETPENLVSRADAALYKAKESGRNCIVLFDEAEPSSIERRAKAG